MVKHGIAGWVGSFALEPANITGVMLPVDGGICA
jgi:hypothetical protein